MKIRHIRLRAISDSKTFGIDIPLGGGLNVIRADNTSGKSTCLMAILYCLGLERSLDPKLQIPLPYTMRTQIQVQNDGGAYQEIVHSYVMIEISNNRGDILCLRRDVKGGTDRKLVRTWLESTIDRVGTSSTQRDFFLHDPGAASREHGFHSFLVDFLELQLPLVSRYDGPECPLYLETLWPMFFVEQKRGWSAIQGPLPTFLRIQDLLRHVMEFVLQLDIADKRRRYVELRREVKYLEQRWKDRRNDLLQRSSTIVRITGIPEVPTSELSYDSDVRVLAYFEDKWIAVDDLATKVMDMRTAAEALVPRDADAAQNEIQNRLNEREDREMEMSAQATVLRQEWHMAEKDLSTLMRRIDTLKIDLKRNQDALKLRRFGSTVLESIVDPMCPTCHQSVERELLPEEGVAVMALDENIAFVRSQLDLYQAVSKRHVIELDDLKAKYHAVRQELVEVRRSIRALKRDLVRPSGAFIWSEIEEVIRLEGLVAYWREIQEEVDGSVDELQDLAGKWTKVKSELRSLGTVEMSPIDQQKMFMLQRKIQEYLELFGFRSFAADEIEVSDGDFRPQVVKKDQDGRRVVRNIGFEVSASDGIRLKWAYYMALLYVSQQLPTNHLGLLIFDEPGQQQMRELDLAEFLFNATVNTERSGQIVLATSEDIERVRDSLEGTSAIIHDYEGFMLKPLE